MKRKLISLLLAIGICAAMLPQAIFAGDVDTGRAPTGNAGQVAGENTPAPPQKDGGLEAGAGLPQPPPSAHIAAGVAPAAQNGIAAKAPNPETDFAFNGATGEVTQYKGTATDVVIPETIGGVAVTRIGETAFNYGRYRKTVNSIILPRGLKSIGEMAFGEQKFQNIVLPEGLESIEDRAFLSCAALEEIKLPDSLTTLGNAVFKQCYGLRRAELSAGLKVLPNETFSSGSGKGSMEEVLLKDGLEEIGADAFYKQKLRTATLPDSVRIIKRQAFGGQQDPDLQGDIFISRSIQEIHAQTGNIGNIANAFVGWKGRIIFPITKAEAAARGADAVLTYPGASFKVFYASTVQYDTNGGEPAIGPETVLFEHPIQNRPADPTKEGYRFAGWYTDSQCTAPWDFQAAVTRDMTLFAKWDANTYQVKYDTGFDDVTIPDKVNVKWEDAGLLPTQTPQKAGYRLTGWELGGTPVAATDKYSDLATDQAPGTFITLQAIWVELSDYRVLYDTAGGSMPGGQPPAINGMKYADTVLTPVPLRDGHIFKGWTYQGAGVADGSSYAALAKDDTIKELELVAQWEAEEYTIHYTFTSTKNPDGIPPPEDLTIGYGAAAEEPSFTVPENWTFDGWYIDRGCTQRYDFRSAVTGDLELYGRWAYTEPEKPTPGGPTAPEGPAGPETKPAGPVPTGGGAGPGLSLLLLAASSGAVFLTAAKGKKAREGKK